MEKCWRWFGRNDKITLQMLRQIGVEGIVTALHDVPNGEIWTKDAICELKDYIESAGLHWSVVESLPVVESIKYGGADRDQLIENYIKSLSNLGEAGIRTVCYNFMPVIDWIRTDLHHRLDDGTSSLYFDYSRFAYFDINILGRKDARNDYSSQILKKVDGMHLTTAERDELIDTIIVKTQGFINGNIHEGDNNPVDLFKGLLAKYDGISKDRLRENLVYFLRAIIPVCDKYGIDMCIHPDDPPYQVLGLPRIVCDSDDIRWILKTVDNPHSGLTFCAGSLSSGAQNNVSEMAREFAPRTRFVHLRTCQLLSDGDFMEASHTNGLLVELIRIFEKTNPSLPMRVDHGRDMLGDEGYNPGYSFHGRMLALGQIEGMITAIKYE